MSSCLDLRSNRVSKAPVIGTLRVDGSLIHSEDAGGHCAICNGAVQMPEISGSAQSAFISSSLVCTVSHRLYLDIEPKILWVYPDLSVDNDVRSNTKWNVD